MSQLRQLLEVEAKESDQGQELLEEEMLQDEQSHDRQQQHRMLQDTC